MDPVDVKEFGLKWADELDADGISTSLWTPPTGLTKASESFDAVTKITTVWLSASAANKKYRVSNKVVTTGGRTLQKSIWIWVSNQ